MRGQKKNSLDVTSDTDDCGDHSWALRGRPRDFGDDYGESGKLRGRLRGSGEDSNSTLAAPEAPRKTLTKPQRLLGLQE